MLIQLISLSSYAQNIFNGILRNSLDSSAIPSAGITLKETGTTVLTNDSGRFQFFLNRNPKQVTITIEAIGAKKTLNIKHPFDKEQIIYLDISANMLDEFALKGLSAEEVVHMAVASIPANYADSGYFDYSFYRRYQKVNGRYMNLMEAYPAVMFRLTKNKQRINSVEAFAVNELRRTTFHSDISNVIEDNPVDLLEVNPVYHLQGSSLYPGRFSSYSFSFDTVNKSIDEYHIKYRCNSFSSDHHGILDYDERNLKGETWETGELVIERRSFAIKKFHRISHRHEDYDYIRLPQPNNRVSYFYRYYFFSFVGGDLLAEYAPHNGKWYLKKLTRQYTDEFEDYLIGTTDFSITDNFEWYSGTISRYTTADYVDKFFSKMATAIHSYDTAFWDQAVPPFQYIDLPTICNDLRKGGSLISQFTSEAKLDDPKRKPISKRK